MGIEKLDNITKLAENLYLIHAPNLARFPHCNGFLFTGRQTVLIDTGIGETRI
ncbi:MAG: hypothetical protein GY857_13450, partial [Desulfobacula sp.]|nr:hypothetical protein [Desulfobacula sp.]